MIPKEFAYSDQAHYPHGSSFKVKKKIILLIRILLLLQHLTVKHFKFHSLMYQKNINSHTLNQILSCNVGEQTG